MSRVDKWMILLFLEHDCKFDRTGMTFQGSIDRTQKGTTCIPWDVTDFGIPEYNFPDESKEDLGNKCRNPDAANAPWCFTGTQNFDFEYCEIDFCGEST